LKEISFEVPSDSDGYVTFECPFCQVAFKLRADEFQSDELICDELFCPYCGLTDNADNFYSKEVYDHMEALVENYMVEQLNNAFGGMAKSFNQIKNVKADFTPLSERDVNVLTEQDTAETIFQCNICENHMKVDFYIGASKMYCAYCGVDL